MDADGQLQPDLSTADRALGRPFFSIVNPPNPVLFVCMYDRKDAVLSSQIEGIQSSLQDLIKAEAEVLGAEYRRDVDKVVNYVAAMNDWLTRLPEVSVSVRLIREIHAELLKGVGGSRLTPGELRTSRNWIGPWGIPGSAVGSP